MLAVEIDIQIIKNNNKKDVQIIKKYWYFKRIIKNGFIYTF